MRVIYALVLITFRHGNPAHLQKPPLIVHYYAQPAACWNEVPKRQPDNDAFNLQWPYLGDWNLRFTCVPVASDHADDLSHASR
jgi:hypothetical protein